jgi:hypothetical protein
MRHLLPLIALLLLFTAHTSRTRAQEPLPPAPDLLGDAGESCRSRFDCAEGLSCVEGVCGPRLAHPMEGSACGARADCGRGMRCVGGRCISEVRLRLEGVCQVNAPWGWRASNATAGVFGAGLSGGGYGSGGGGGGIIIAFALRGGALFKNRFPLLAELGPEFNSSSFHSSFKTRGQLTVMVGAYAGRYSVAWAPKFGIGGSFGGGGFYDEYTFNVASLSVRTGNLVVDFDVFSYRVRRRDIDREWASHELEHRMLTGFAFYRVMRRSR